MSHPPTRWKPSHNIFYDNFIQRKNKIPFHEVKKKKDHLENHFYYCGQIFQLIICNLVHLCRLPRMGNNQKNDCRINMRNGWPAQTNQNGEKKTIAFFAQQFPQLSRSCAWPFGHGIHFQIWSTVRLPKAFSISLERGKKIRLRHLPLPVWLLRSIWCAMSQQMYSKESRE